MNSVNDIRQRLVDSDLLTSDDADSHLAEWQEETSAWDDVPSEDFVDWLIEQNVITEFQGDAIIQGHVGPFLLGPYRVKEQIAAGRLGAVYRAVHDEFDQPVSLKIFPRSLKDDSEKLARMGREARIFAELDHPNVLRSYEVGCVANTYYLALEDLHGETLAKRLERETRIPYEQACQIMQDVANGLQHLHENDVVHRDLRPDSIWIGENGVNKVIEFGAARDAFAEIDTTDEGAQLTQTETVIGDYEYMAPEQAQDVRDASELSDIYGLGCVLYHCLAGHPPFTDKNPVQLVLKHLNAEVPRISEILEDVPHQLDETLEAMLAKDPTERFQSASDVAYALGQYIKSGADDDRVVVVDVSQQYLDWVNSQKPSEPSQIPDNAVAITPELTDFLGWMSQRQKRRRRRKQ